MTFAATTPAGMGRPARLGWWAGAAALVAIELAITSLILVPRVSPDYAAYYVKQDARCYLDDGLPRVDLGRVVGGTDRYAINRCLLDQNWATLHDWGSVLNGPSGRLAFRLAEVPAGDLRLSFVAAADGRFEAPTITVSAGGQQLGMVALSRATGRVYAMTVPRSALDGDALELTFQLAPGRASALTAPEHRRFGLLRWQIDAADAARVTTLPKPGYF